jgi:hypothetical protein
MTSKRVILRRQRAWAKSAGLAPDSRGHLATVESNLFRPFAASTLAAFQAGNGSELKQTPSRPAKMRALHSSAVLAVNVFDYWVDRDVRPLLDVLGIDAGMKRLSFEAQFPTGLAGNPPNLDLALELCNETVVGIECKYIEWLALKRKSRLALKDKYFESGASLWSEAGLPMCQALAADLRASRASFRHLDAAQLLKHALGLATQRQEQAALFYVYYDVRDRSGDIHRDEIKRFSALVDPGLKFRALSYQSLIGDLSLDDGIDADYLAYPRSRYLR